MRPRLNIDITPLFEPQWTGIPVFTRRLVQSLIWHGGVDLSFSHQLCDVPPDLVHQALRAGTGTFMRGTLDRARPEDRRTIDRAVPCFSPTVKAAFNISAREASTVHDLSTLFMPEHHEAANVAYHLDHFCEELASNEVTFCVSQATAAALSLAYPSAAQGLRTLYQFADWPPEFEIIDRNLPALRLGRYAVVVGTVEPRKNLGLLLSALPLPEMARSKLRFVIIGKKGWKVDEFLASLTDQDRQKLVFSGFVSEFTKYRLIKNAEFLVFPSVYEGFGIPALEAMSLGKPVLAARTSSLPEVIGDAGLYFDPFSPRDFAAALADIEPPEKLAELAPRAVQNSRAFGWERMAQPVVEWLKS